jgi:hypothetical protein
VVTPVEASELLTPAPAVSTQIRIGYAHPTSILATCQNMISGASDRPASPDTQDPQETRPEYCPVKVA